MKSLTCCFLLLISCSAVSSDESPYTGQELRSIKSLSSSEISSLQRGEGMGFAKLAELNHFPGPKHVLDLSDKLELSQSQLAATNSLFDEMQSKAVDLGEKLLAAELALDNEFERGTINPLSLRSSLLDIGELRAQLRYVHLEAHLRQKQLLSPTQIASYNSSRGYSTASPEHDSQSHTQH